MSIDLKLQGIWYGRSRAAWVLLPLSYIFFVVVLVRRALYKCGLFRSYRLAKPVVVVGNLTVGGTGKTPLVIWLANTLGSLGIRVGVITRGYGGKAITWPQQVTADSDPHSIGDEAVLIAQQTNALVVAGPNRVASGQWAVAAGAELIISDDGLQHYRLQRDYELLVIDASRCFGNGHLLPAGPLREPVTRLQQVDLVVVNQRDLGHAFDCNRPMVSYNVSLGGLRSLVSSKQLAIDYFVGQRVHVITAIGHPHSFISALERLGMTVDSRLYPDHAQFSRQDIDFDDDLPILMTEKDAVKCSGIADSRHWAVSIDVQLSDPDREQLLMRIQQVMHQFSAHH